MTKDRSPTYDAHHLAEQLAAIFPRMMQQFVRLGHQLPPSAIALTPQQLRLLSVLHYAEGPLSMSEVAQCIGVTQGTLTDVAKRLIAMDLIHRQRSTADDRIVQLSLPPKGEAIMKDLQQEMFASYLELCQGLSAKEGKKLLDSHRYIFETYSKLVARKNLVKKE